MKKRILSVLLTGVMVLSFAACGSKGSDGAGKKYTIATDTTFAPFEFEGDDGNMVGIDIELVNAIAEKKGFEVEWQYIGFQAAMTALESGEADGMIAGMSITDERKEKYDFSQKYTEALKLCNFFQPLQTNAYFLLQTKFHKFFALQVAICFRF